MVCITNSPEAQFDRSTCEELQGVECNWCWNILENWHLYNNKLESICNIPAFCFSVAKSKFRVFLYCVWTTVFAFIVKWKTLENVNCVIAGNFCYIATQFMPLSILYFIVFHVFAMPLHFSTETAEQSCVNSLQEWVFKSNTQFDLLLCGHWDRFFIILSTSASVLWISNQKLPPVQAESNMGNNVLRVQLFFPYKGQWIALLKNHQCIKSIFWRKGLGKVSNHPAGNIRCPTPAKALMCKIYITGSMTKIKWFCMNTGIKGRNQLQQITWNKYQYHHGLGRTEVVILTLNTRT